MSGTAPEPEPTLEMMEDIDSDSAAAFGEPMVDEDHCEEPEQHRSAAPGDEDIDMAPNTGTSKGKVRHIRID